MFVDGVEGLEPPNDWTKTSCLTTWRYPNELVAETGFEPVTFGL